MMRHIVNRADVAVGYEAASCVGRPGKNIVVATAVRLDAEIGAIGMATRENSIQPNRQEVVSRQASAVNLQVEVDEKLVAGESG